MHQFVIHELGPILTDQRVSEAELRHQVDEQLQRRSPRSASPSPRRSVRRSCNR